MEKECKGVIENALRLINVIHNDYPVERELLKSSVSQLRDKLRKWLDRESGLLELAREIDALDEITFTVERSTVGKDALNKHSCDLFMQSFEFQFLLCLMEDSKAEVTSKIQTIYSKTQ